ncbi:MAG: helix-turn-helix domain-containing protein [Deltaproteobacteria bacterium]|nr:helix-turn-helix domain-containing protein [Deltaproteobacteria bacterium]
MPSQPTEITKRKKAQRISNPFAKRLFTLREAGLYLGRSEYSVRTLIWSGTLPVVKHGKKQWVDIVDMDTFIEKNKETIQ